MRCYVSGRLSVRWAFSIMFVSDYYPLLRRFLFLLPPEAAHSLSLKAIRYLPRQKSSVESLTEKACFLSGLKLKNRVGLAAGFDKDGDCIDALFNLGFGFIEVGTVTPLPQPGNLKPRLFRVPAHSALINRMGFNNKGVDYLVRNLRRRKVKGVVGVNIGKNKETSLNKAAEDYLMCLDKVYPYADYIVVNTSSPNTPGLRDLMGQAYLSTLLGRIMEKYEGLVQQHQKALPLFLKTTVDVADEDIKNIVSLALEYQLSGIISSNTTIERKLIAGHGYASQKGGLSGSPLTDVALTRMRLLRSLVPREFALIGVGGIMSAEDAKNRLQAGADVLQLYTGFVYSGPALIRNIVNAVKSV